MNEYLGIYITLTKLDAFCILAETKSEAEIIFKKVLRQEGYKFINKLNSRVVNHYTQSLDGVFLTIHKGSLNPDKSL